jgi:hypothetical protein
MVQFISAGFAGYENIRYFDISPVYRAEAKITQTYSNLDKDLLSLEFSCMARLKLERGSDVVG